jgi:hypothetical protein
VLGSDVIECTVGGFGYVYGVNDITYYFILNWSLNDDTTTYGYT